MTLWKQIRTAFALGLRRPMTGIHGRSIGCMKAEAQKRPCDCGELGCAGWGPW
jgi:hypothetical protein